MTPPVLPERLLCGPGPSNVPASVYAALAEPIVGHLDPAFLALMDTVGEQLRLAFATSNERTFAISGTGSAGMEAAFVNLLQPGECAVIGVNGVFGTRMCEVARRCGAYVVAVEHAWGDPVDPALMATAVREHGDVRVVAFVQAETSTGAETDAEAVIAAVRAEAPEVFAVVDVVTSLAGSGVHADLWDADVCYAGTQKCLSVPPGLAPVTFSPRAVAHIANRATPPQSWYLDLNLLGGYLDSGTRAYHHTAPVSMLLGLHEGLRLALDEGLDARAARHRRVGEAFQAELEARGMTLFAAKGARLPQLTSVYVPEGIDEAAFRRNLLATHGIEIGGGLGAYAGKVWRIGLMGENARDEVAERILAVLP